MRRKKVLYLLAIIFQLASMAGCWNYREINDLSIVAGVAIDIAENDQYELTVELVKTKSSGKQTEIISEVVSKKGKTIFDAIRKYDRNK